MTTRSIAGWTAVLTLGPVLAAFSAPPGTNDRYSAASTGTEGPQVPVALAWGRDGMLRVALRDARQIAVVDVATGRVAGRTPLPFRPSSLASGSEGVDLLVGGTEGELLAVGPRGQTALLAANGKGAVRVVVLPKGRAAVVTPWERALRVVDTSEPRVIRSIPLPFGPGAIVAREGGRLVVAEAFGGRIAAVDPETGRVLVRVLDGVNLVAMALSGDGKELLVGHMAQFGNVPVTSTNIDWGLVLSSRLSAVRLAELDRDDPALAGVAVPRRRLTLDGSRHGAADPSALAVSRDGTVVMIALSGAHQVLKNDRTRGSRERESADLLSLGHNQGLEVVEVGRSPTDLLLDPSGESVVTADSMSDTLTVVDVRDLSVVRTIRLGADPPRRSVSQRGEAAFLDGRHGLDRWMSCASCHARGHTNGLNFDTLGDGGYGAAKNTPTLLGVGPTAPFAWTGQFRSLAGQVHQSLRTSLHGPSTDEPTSEEIAAYLQTLAPPPPLRIADDPAVLRGARVFESRRCQVCHRPPSYTTAGTRDVGLDDGAGGHRTFNPPSLRGVGWSAPYFHDGRASTLDAVLKTHPPGTTTSPLSTAERGDLAAFLEAL